MGLEFRGAPAGQFLGFTECQLGLRMWPHSAGGLARAARSKMPPLTGLVVGVGCQGECLVVLRLAFPAGLLGPLSMVAGCQESGKMEAARSLGAET